MIEFTEDELRYLANRLLRQDYWALLEVGTREGCYIEVCPDCLHEVRYTSAGEEVGHTPKCPRQIRYALMDKLDAYYGEEK